MRTSLHFNLMSIISNGAEKKSQCNKIFLLNKHSPHIFSLMLRLETKYNTDIYDQILICNKCFEGKKCFVATITPTFKATSRAIRRIRFFSRSKEIP